MLSNCEIIAKHIDQTSGFSIQITRMPPTHPERYQHGLERKGIMWVTDDKGITVQAGYWMDWPENGWNLTDEEYYMLPDQRRAALEARQQVLFHGGLTKLYQVHHESRNHSGKKTRDPSLTKS